MDTIGKSISNSQNKNKIWEHVRKHVLIFLYAN